MPNEQWPELPYAAWKDTAATLQLWAQIVGKIRLALTPWLNHSWHVTLHVSARGLATPLMPRIGTKPIIVTGALVASGGIYVLSHVPVDGAFVANLLPGISAVAIGLGCVFTGVTTDDSLGADIPLQLEFTATTGQFSIDIVPEPASLSLLALEIAPFLIRRARARGARAR